MSTLTSNANNFSEFITAGVDPRTGSYSLSFLLGELLSNKLSGPNFKAVINYNSLDSHQGVFGVGWSLAISAFDKNSSTLTLQSGQSFRIEWNSSLEEYDIPYRRCKDIRVFYQSLPGQSTGEIVVAHKNGTAEYIDWDTGTVNRILSPHGHKIEFHYTYYNNKKVLWKVSDSSESILHIDWFSVPSQTLVSLYSGSDLKARVTLWKDGQGLLQYVSLPNDNSLYTTIEYRYVPACSAQLVTKVTHPTGLTEDITYLDEGHTLQTGAPIEKLPYVTKSILTPGVNQEPTITVYDYSDNNYLGYGSDAAWEEGQDVLFSAQNSYKYSSTETIGSIQIKRIYNKYHLLEEEFYSKDHLLYQHQKNTYFANLSLSIGFQPANYSFVKKEALTFYVNNESRTELRERMVDDYGNETWLKNEDGSEIHRLFYPKNGEIGTDDEQETVKCPAHPFEMIRFMKEERLVPASKLFGETDRVKTLTYQRIDSLVDGQYFVTPAKQTSHNCQIVFDYHRDKNRPHEYGRLKSRTTLTNGTESISNNDYTFSEGNLVMHNFIETHDGNVAAKEERFDYITGKMTRTEDDRGITLEVEHNSFGLVTVEKVAPGTEKERKKNFVYHHGSNRNQIVVTDNRGLSETYQFNNAGNLIRRKKKDRNAFERIVEERNYNQLGQIVSTTSRDWCEIRDTETGTVSTKQICKSEFYEYDVWGELNKLTRPDGIVEIIDKNPVLLSTYTKVEGLSSQWSTFNLAGKELATTFYDKNGQEIATTSNNYDGYHRLNETTDANNQTTSFTYDANDRLTDQYTTAEGTTHHISLEYESFSLTELTSVIKVNGHVMGAREYDGLGRIKSETKLGGTTTFLYAGSSAKASQIMTPNGNVLSLNYDPYLDQVVSITEATDATKSCTYLYDNETGYLKEESTLHSKHVYSYNTLSQLNCEAITLGDSEERQSEYDYSLLGNLLSETDFSGVEKLIGYDDQGRIQTINFNDKGRLSSIDIHYDEYGRESGVTSTSGSNTLTTTIEFNAVGYEEKRELLVNGTLNTKVESTYYNNGALHTRTFTNQLGVTLETLTYDGFNRLKSYLCTGHDLPKDHLGKKIGAQSYTYDQFGSIQTVSSVFEDGSTDTCTYSYDVIIVTQLKSVSHTHADYADSVFSYDNAGNQLTDEKERIYTYDSFNRLESVHTSECRKLSDYTYDSRGFLVIQKPTDYADIEYYYRGEGIINQYSGGVEANSKMYNEQILIRTVNEGEAYTNVLLGADSQGSVTVTLKDNGISSSTENRRYPPHGNS